MVLSLNAIGVLAQISNSIGDSFFVITSLTICLVLGAFIGDLIGKNRETILFFAHKFRNRLFYSKANGKIRSCFSCFPRNFKSTIPQHVLKTKSRTDQH